ncbi:TetR/AcrR family transcriptional regulator [Desulforhopalus singaporensis]|uniref:Transcriptional regulator, TetR family n=1 Tax=Desulforhopalus singaporensis TaxID=91360 RepID=A0A1H0TCG4_9BACT|nr:TetR family transcriptional regulator C-terminal domain-containing protein [Desulforhopalus singaporensis]SDP51707.1 transcriptional regulator, TetR family [Desulforhopalus singaporensis]
MPARNQTTSRSRQKQLTRQKLLDATIEIIADEGLSGVTLAKVAQRTGLSRGICNFHFETKEHLMHQAFRMLYREHECAWRKVLADKNESPEARLTTFIRTLLLPPIADHKKLSVWMAFWGVAPHRKTYLEIGERIDREYEQAVEGLLREISGGDEVVHGMTLHDIAITLTCMIDGFWVNYLISPKCLAPENAVESCRIYLSRFFPSLGCSGPSQGEWGPIG